MNPEIWGKLPWDLIERIADFADIDTRRALGVPPRRLPRSDFVPRPLPPTTFRYFPALKKVVYINFDESYDVFCWEVYEDVEPIGDAWVHGQQGYHRGIWRGRDGFMGFHSPGDILEFNFVERPEFVSCDTHNSA